MIQNHFNELKLSLGDVKPSNIRITSYDETCFVDDLKRKNFYSAGGCRDENVIDNSKTSTFVMFAVAGDDSLLFVIN